ncbi:NADPH:quinone reductase-like Zn-dependent oxidoreductase [Arthrobacter sp. AG1021]|nr:NADPH:quinone reductase-like Zn-dependent oxidoreductase [Arthrobacter sp. AG1021]
MFMRAATVSHFGGPEAVEITEVPVPVPGPGQVRIKVSAAALNPVDAAMRSGVFGGEGERIGLGWDVAGTIDAVGAGVNWPVGDRVIGLATGHNESLGTHADYVVLDAEAIAPAPASLDDVHAAALPLNALSAAQALGLLAVRPGQSLLVTGAAGGVGGHTVELAHRQGLEVTVLASAGDIPFLVSRGANHFLTRGANLAPAGFDGVLDAAGLGNEAIAAVQDGGSYVGLWPGQEPDSERGVRVDALDVRADGAQLAELSRLADQGEIRARVAQTYPLEEATAAHARLAEGSLRGRLVLIP